MSDKYKNGKMYTIRYKNDDSLIYVGSTVQPLFKRWHQHKKNSINEKSIKYNYPLYKKIRDTYIYKYIYPRSSFFFTGDSVAKTLQFSWVAQQALLYLC